MKQSKVVANLDGLEAILREFGGNWVTKVGILGSDGASPHFETKKIKAGSRTINAVDKSKPQDITNAEIGLIQELGSETNNMPPRSFLRMPIEDNEKEIISAMGGNMAKSEFEKGNIKGIYKLLGFVAEGIVKKAFASGGYGKWQPLKASTIRAKGSSAPLIDTGQLRRSISSEVVKKSDLNG